MGEFTKRVRDNEIPGPLRRTFSAARFEAAHAQSADHDADDDRTLAAGIALHKKLDAIRASLPLSISDRFSATTKLRAFVAMANQSFFVTREKTEEAIEAFQADREASSAEAYALEEMAGIKLDLPGGFSWLPNEIVESVVTYSQPVGHVRQMNWAAAPNRLGTAAVHLGTEGGGSQSNCCESPPCA